MQTSYSAITGIKDYLWRVFELAAVLLAIGAGVVFATVRALQRRAWV